MADTNANDINNLPNVPGLEAVAAQIAAQSNNQNQPAAQTPADNTQSPVNNDQSQVKTPDGKQIPFKTIEDAFKAYQEVQGFTSRLAQENKDMKEKLGQAESQLETFRLSMQGAPVGTPPPQNTNQNFDADFIQNPEQAIANKVAATVAQTRIAEVLQDEQLKNKEEFNERYAYARQIVAQNPGLINSIAGIRKAFELGDQRRQQDLRAQSERILKMTFGDDVDIEKLKTQFKKNGTLPTDTGSNINPNLAYMPDTGMHTGIRTQTGNVGHDAQIAESANKGDVDATVAAVFNKMLAST